MQNILSENKNKVSGLSINIESPLMKQAKESPSKPVVTT